MLHTFNLSHKKYNISSRVYIKYSWELYVVSQQTTSSFQYLTALEFCNANIHNAGLFSLLIFGFKQKQSPKHQS